MGDFNSDLLNYVSGYQTSDSTSQRVIPAPQPNEAQYANLPAYTSPEQVNTFVPSAHPLNPQPERPQGSPLKRTLARFFYGFGQAALHNAGLPTDAALAMQQAQMDHLHASAEMERAQATNQILNAQMMQRRMAAFEHFQDPFAQFGDLSPEEQAIRTGAMQAVAQTGDITHALSAISHVATLRAATGRQAAAGKFDVLTVTPEMVAAGAPSEWLGQAKPADQLQKWTSRAVFGNVPVIGAVGPALANRNPPVCCASSGQPAVRSRCEK